MASLATQFAGLVQRDPLIIGQVVTSYGNGTSKVSIIGGNSGIYQGPTYANGTWVSIRRDVIIGTVEELPTYTAEV